MVTRLPFTLPDWTRVAWASAAARQVWEPRIQRITAAWTIAERLSVVHGIRRAALQPCQPDQLPELSRWAADTGLVVLPVERQGIGGGSYSASATPLVAGRPWQYRALVTRPEDMTAALSAWGEDEALGRLLGYPPCCRAFFRRTWGAGQVDTTWDMAQEGTAGPDGANILLRWLGVRLVPHLPCSFGCAPSARLGEAMAQVLAEAGFQDELAWLQQMLRWPVEWSALHGIALIVTPVCQVSARTDATAERLLVQRQGEEYPAEGARGLRFPFRVGRQRTRAQQPATTRISSPGPSWLANGFRTYVAQEAAHGPLLQLLASSGLTGAVLDLGAGDGLLAQRAARLLGGPALAVEIGAPAARAARARLGADAVIEGCLSGPWPGQPPYGLVLLMPGRLLELGAERAAVIRRRLEVTARAVLCYAYGDWLERYGGLEALLQAAALGDWTVTIGTRATAGAAAVLLQPRLVEQAEPSKDRGVRAALAGEVQDEM